MLSLAVASVLLGQGSLLPAVARAENGQAQTGIVKEETYVRSGPAVNKFYATASLPAGSHVTVVGSKPGWYYIVPPDGSFCCVAKGYVQRVENSAIGKVVQPDLRVRAGSSLNNEMSTVLPVRLVEGASVQIIGEVGEWFKIVPPAGTYLYVEQSAVDLTPAENAVKPVESQSKPPVKPIEEVKPAKEVVEAQPSANTTIAPTEKAVAPATQPSEVATAPITTQPTGPSADAKFEELESQFAAATKQSLEEQPIDSLLQKYQRLTEDPSLGQSRLGIANTRVTTLKLRASAREEYAVAQKMQAEATARRQALKAEQQELAEKAKAAEVVSYTAVGTLRLSSLQPAGVTLYRLTDPATGRTILYVRGSDKVVALLDKFVGVRGDIQTDDALSMKTINPTEIESVDPAKVGNTVTATVVPSSLIGKAQ